MDRRGFLKLMGAAAAGMALPNAAFAEDGTMSKKNVLFILSLIHI